MKELLVRNLGSVAHGHQNLEIVTNDFATKQMEIFAKATTSLRRNLMYLEITAKLFGALQRMLQLVW
jgi:hypothetical protein